MSALLIKIVHYINRFSVAIISQ